MEDARAKAAKAWADRTAEWEDMVRRGVGIRMPDGSKIDPKDVKVEIGPPMTAEEFARWQERRQKFAKNFSQ